MTGSAGWWHARPADRWSAFAVAAGLAAAALLGAAMTVRPLPAGALVGAVWLAALGATYAAKLPRVFLGALWGVLLCYAVLGKGGAYINVGGIFVGEMVLGVGLLMALFSGVLRYAFRSPYAWIILAFGAWGAARTIPYVSTYRMDALRDAVAWGYSAFAVLVAGVLLRTGALPRVAERYGRTLVWIPFWTPVAWAIFTYGASVMPWVPGTAIPVLHWKAGDYALHLTGAAAFVLLGLHRGPDAPPAPASPAPPALPPARRPSPLAPGAWAWWAAWLTAFAFAGASSRGALLAMILGVGAVLALRPSVRVWRPAVVGVALLAAFVVSGVKVEVRDSRYLSATELLANLQLGTQRGNRDVTVEWRLQWWKDIVNYTVFGEYFWGGKGYGINVALDDGYGSLGDDERYALRSPHNGHVTILARSGVPGMVLWVALHGSFLVALAYGHWRLRRTRDDWWGRLNLWVLGSCVAFLVNAATEVTLENPQGGIWFWSIVGVGMAALEVQRRRPAAAARPTAAARPA
jgi:hypothetical protein